jgi:hypothetical protein
VTPKVKLPPFEWDDQIAVVFDESNWQLWQDRPVCYLTPKQARKLIKRLRRALNRQGAEL